MHGRRLSLVLPRKEKRKNGKTEALGNLDFKPGFPKLSCYYEANNFSAMKLLHKNAK